MLHMVISTHGPDTCPAVVEENKKRALAMGPRMDEVSKAHGCALQGGWINRVNHVSYVIVDAPNAHAVEDAVWELKMAEWNTIEIHPIITLEEAMKTLAEA